jgi:hypothetical protein
LVTCFAAALCGPASARQPCPPSWAPVIPEARSQCAMAYDADRGMTVLYGGQGESTSDERTWEWDGRRWWARALSGPGPRVGHAMVYDHAHRLTLLFGGSGTYPFMEWDGDRWHPIDETGPGSRNSVALAADPYGHVLLFGGFQMQILGDTWEWDGTTWTLRATTGPSPRIGACMAFDQQTNSFVLFGGDNFTNPPADTWRWDGSAWSLDSATGPAGRASATMTATDQGLVLVGGWTDLGASGETWLLNSDGWTLVAGAGLPGRAEHAAAYDSGRGLLTVFGGSSDASLMLGDLWVWDGRQWRERYSDPPAPRQNQAMAFDADRGETLMFGGVSGYNNPWDFFGDTWRWNGVQWELAAASGPAARRDAAMAFDSARGRVVLYGGQECCGGPSEYDTWEWDGLRWALRATTGPGVRAAQAMAYDSRRGRTVLFGGRQRNTAPLGDTWEWDGGTWTQVATGGPPPRAFHTMAFDASRGRTVVFGGYADSAYLNDTWDWDGSSWRQAMPVGQLPRPRFGHAMVYDAARRVCVMLGGQSTNRTEHDTWEWDGAAWTMVDATDPPFRYLFAAAYDEGRGRVVTFGGSANPLRGDTWERGLREPPTLHEQPQGVTIDPQTTVRFNVAALGDGPLSYQWRRNGTPLSDGGRIQGATSRTLTITGAGAEDEGVYEAVVSSGCPSVVSDPATLTVLCPADFDGDGRVALVDFVLFLGVYASGNHRADLNHDGMVSIGDFLQFLVWFSGGCQ